MLGPALIVLLAQERVLVGHKGDLSMREEGVEVALITLLILLHLASGRGNEMLETLTPLLMILQWEPLLFRLKSRNGKG